jgi:hypothetical protein
MFIYNEILITWILYYFSILYSFFMLYMFSYFYILRATCDYEMWEFVKFGENLLSLVYVVFYNFFKHDKTLI